MTTQKKIKALLQKHFIEINFTKTDGTNRKMTCTLREDIIPPTLPNNSDQHRQNNENTIAVWDTEKNAYRSFRFNSLIDYTVLEEGYEL